MPRRTQPRRAIISGYVLKLTRESASLSQERLAEAIGADRGTIQGWESGRRPLTAIAYGDAVALQQRLLSLGARPDLIATMPAAVDADLLLSAILDEAPTSDLQRHPLGWTVLSHAVVEMLLWATAGHQPRICASLPPRQRRGPVAESPELEVGATEAFFGNLRTLASRARGSEDRLLLHRQACFLASVDASASEWIKPSARTLEHFRRAAGWSPYWSDARSLAVALARNGDPEPLQDFIARADGDTDWETANLNYWAYWAGEIPGKQPDDRFMTDTGIPWRGSRLYAHLTSRLDPSDTRINLNIHSLWALLGVRRGLAFDDPAATSRLLAQSEALLDSDVISNQAKSELGSIRYALTMEGLAPKKEGP